MNIFLFCSLYYRKDIITGANKRFENFIYYFQKHLKEKESIIVVIKKGHIPDNLLNSKSIRFIEIPLFKIFDRLFSYILLSVKFLFLKKMVIYSDFMPIPLMSLSKHNHYQLIHDLRNFTEYNRSKLGNIQKKQWQNCKKIITISDFTKRELIKKCNIKESNIFVSPNGLDSRYYKENNDSNYKYDILYIATFEKRKNHTFLIDALSYYKGKKTINVCFIGRDLGYKKIVQEKCQYLKSNVKINFIKSIDNENDIIKMYDQSKIFVYPSLYEGFGMPLIEAMSRGCKVLCSDIEIFREIGGNIPKFFNLKSSETLMSLIEKELPSKGIRNQEVLNMINNYSWEKITQNFYFNSKIS